MRALRDFNIPKIVTDDMPVFMGLIGDLFPALDVPRKRDLTFEAQIKNAILDLHLQPEDSFILKVSSTSVECIYLHVIGITLCLHVFSISVANCKLIYHRIHTALYTQAFESSSFERWNGLSSLFETKMLLNET